MEVQTKDILFVFVCVARKTTEQNSCTRPGFLNKGYYHIETSSFELIGTVWFLVTAQKEIALQDLKITRLNHECMGCPKTFFHHCKNIIRISIV